MRAQKDDATNLPAFFGLLCLAMFVSLGIAWALMLVAQLIDGWLP